MTRAQERAIENFKKQAIGMYGYTETKEFKRLEVEENEEFGYVSLLLEVGMVGDEGTMAAIICRHTYYVFIGKQGGYYSYRKSGKRATYSSAVRAVIYTDLYKKGLK